MEKVEQILAQNHYMTIATSSLDSKPWISSVSFAYDTDYNFFWVSDKNALHSSLIRNNPRVAMTIFNSSTETEENEAIYLEAEAHELERESDIKYAINVLSTRPKREDLRVKEVEQVVGKNAWRIYQAIPIRVHKLTKGEHINGQYVDKHIEISIKK